MKRNRLWILAACIVLLIATPLVASNYFIRRDPNHGLRQLIQEQAVEIEQLKIDVADIASQVVGLSAEAVGFRTDTAKWRRNEIIRLSMLASVPAGSTDMIDYTGVEAVWTQDRIDGIMATIEEHQLRLLEMGFERYVYEVSP